MAFRLLGNDSLATGLELRIIMKKFLPLILILLVVGACSSEIPGALTMDDAEREAWEIRLVEMRIDRNEKFMDPDQSPLLQADQADFIGLNYYYPDVTLRFVTKFEKADSEETVVLEKRTGKKVEYLRKGSVSFKIDEEIHVLWVYGPVDTTSHGDYLWLPFYDATTGKETYAGGRYLDLEINDDGTVELDFNFAYNPLCDYNTEDYNCTMPPADNTLNFEVTAGEKSFHLEL
jgi:hypothetical protein